MQTSVQAGNTEELNRAVEAGQERMQEKSKRLDPRHSVTHGRGRMGQGDSLVSGLAHG